MTVTVSAIGDLPAFGAGGSVIIVRKRQRPWWQHYPLALASVVLWPLGVRVPVLQTVRETRHVTRVSAGATKRSRY